MTERFFDAQAFVNLLPALIFLTAYLLGSVPFGLLIARIFHVKGLTTKGSGSTGATNVSRVVGFWPAGFLTFALDVSKGVLAVLIGMPGGGRVLLALLGYGDAAEAYASDLFTIWGAAFFAVLGHCYSPWLQFKGGKGVATGLGTIIVLSPFSAIFGLIGFVLTFLHRRIASLASIAGLILAAIAHLVWNPVGAHLWIGAAILFVILLRHESNIDALLEDREKSFR